MDIQESLERFVESGVSLRRIAAAAKINKNTITSLYKGNNVSQETVDKVKGAMKDIALELYNVAYYDEVNKDEEWEE